MLRFNAVPFTSTVSAINACQVELSYPVDHDNSAALWERLNKTLENVESRFNELTPSISLQLQFRRLRAQIATPPVNREVIAALLVELHENLLAEMSAWLYLMIPPEHRALYLQLTPPFGQEVADQFPEANYDIGAAARCMALDQWTACVFHLMRVLELGLHSLVARMNLQAKPLKEWHHLITDIENEVTRLKGLPHHDSARPDAQTITFYSEAATNFRHFKDAWRNHVAHSRDKYDAIEATAILNHVSTFMQILARGGLPVASQSGLKASDLR